MSAPYDSPAPWRSWRRFWSSPSTEAASAGIHGEIAVARGRLVLTLLIVAIPIAASSSAAWGTENRIAFGFAVFAGFVAGVVYAIVVRRWQASWVAFATSIADVTLVSLLQASYLIAGMPTLAANSRTTFAVYLLAIAATALRLDVRVCVTAGAVATVQYAAIAGAAWYVWSAQPTPETAMYGQIVLGQQAARLILLVVATWIAASVVRQSSVLRHSATHDLLTGLQNRSYFEERFTDELERARRSRRPLCVAMLDLDHFKRVNDTWGHGVGDVALRNVARALRATVRRTDLVARYGGEEFAIVLPDADPAEGATRLESIRAHVRAFRITVAESEPPLTVSVSVGVASFPGDGETVGDLVRVADERLLEAKRAGRDRVVTAPSATPRHS